MKDHMYVIQPELAWKHQRATVRAKHQLNFAKEKRPCDYCRIIKNCRTLTEYYCVECKVSFVLVVSIIIFVNGIALDVTKFVHSRSCYFCNGH